MTEDLGAEVAALDTLPEGVLGLEAAREQVVREVVFAAASVPVTKREAGLDVVNAMDDFTLL